MDLPMRNLGNPGCGSRTTRYRGISAGREALRTRRLGVRVPPSAPTEPQVAALPGRHHGTEVLCHPYSSGMRASYRDRAYPANRSERGTGSMRERRPRRMGSAHRRWVRRMTSATIGRIPGSARPAERELRVTDVSESPRGVSDHSAGRRRRSAPLLGLIFLLAERHAWGRRVRPGKCGWE